MVTTQYAYIFNKINLIKILGIKKAQKFYP